MNLPREAKEKLKKEIVAGLAEYPEVRRVIVFGSFATSDEPPDLDIAFHNLSPTKTQIIPHLSYL